jgi:hypothetical protein
MAAFARRAGTARRREGYGSATRKTARCEQSDTDADTRSDQAHRYWTPQLVDPPTSSARGPWPILAGNCDAYGPEYGALPRASGRTSDLDMYDARGD